MSTLKLLRRDEVIEFTGLSKTTIRGLSENGVFPPAVNVGGARAVRYIEAEINAVMFARAAGATDSDVKRLVANLIEARKQRFDELLCDLCA